MAFKIREMMYSLVIGCPIFVLFCFFSIYFLPGQEASMKHFIGLVGEAKSAAELKFHQVYLVAVGWNVVQEGSQREVAI